MHRCAVLAVLTVLMAVGGGEAAIAQSHSQEDEAACSPDVRRLCRDLIPDRDAIIACLTEKRRELKPPCAKVFARPAARNEGARRQPTTGQTSSAAD